jgi:hypothetical protein
VTELSDGDRDRDRDSNFAPSLDSNGNTPAQQNQQNWGIGTKTN